MSKQSVAPRPVPKNLDTAYVSLGAFIRYLQGRGFGGRVHLELDDYEADIFFKANEPPRVRETNHATTRTDEGEAALHRLLVRASEPGGLISVYEEGEEETPIVPYPPSTSRDVEPPREELTGVSSEEIDRAEMVRLSGELIATVERAALSTGADFQSLFRTVRLGMADDYSFLDPATGRFEYSNGAVRLHAMPAANAYVSGISEALRRIVNKISTGPRAQSVRERVALELAVLARRRRPQLTHFKFTSQLDRIAGTRVL
jgi:hypothetical protein